MPGKKRTSHGAELQTTDPQLKIKLFISSFHLQYFTLILMSLFKLAYFVHLYFADHAKESTFGLQSDIFSQPRDPFRDPSL